jgi:alpha-mannosidase
MTDRRTFLGSLAGVAGALRSRLTASAPGPVIEAHPTALYAQPDGHNNLVRVVVTGLDAPAARARVTDTHGRLVGSAGLLPTPAGLTLAGEVLVPLSEPSEYQFEIVVGKDRRASRKIRLTPTRRWTLYWLSTNHTDIGYTDLQERCLEIHRRNLDAALSRLTRDPDYRWSAECALQLISYAENRDPERAQALIQALRDGKIGFQALFANLLTGLLDHETAARMVWPAGVFARENGLGFVSAQITDVPGQIPTFPMILAASGVKYLASGPNPDRALPLLMESEGVENGLTGPWTPYPQLYWWESPDGSRVLHWRNHHYGDGLRFGFHLGAAEMGRRLSDWLLTNPVFLSPDWSYDVALLYGVQWDNAPVDERMITNMEDFNRRFAYPRIVPGRAEDFFRDVESRYGTRIPVRRGDTGLYWEDGAASTALELATFRRAQLALRAADLLALWDEHTEAADDGRAARIAGRMAERRAAWRDALLFGEHTWGAAESIDAPDARQTVEQWEYKRRFVLGAGAAAHTQVTDALARLAAGQDRGRWRVAFNAGSWNRTDVARIPGGAGKGWTAAGVEVPAVDLPDGDALALVSNVPALGYLALSESDHPARPPVDEGSATDAAAGGFRVRIDQTTGAVASLTGPDGRERVKSSPWSGLNQAVYVTGGERSALWTSGDRRTVANAPSLDVAQATLVSAQRERLPGIGVRLVIERRLKGFSALTSTVTLYDALPWVDFENRLDKDPALGKEALYFAFPFAFTQPTVEMEIPLGRMTAERDQQPGACRDWFCHQHWVWLHEGTDGLLWSGPDTPLFTLNDIFRGTWARRITPDGTLLAYAMNNYWFTNYAARQDGPFTFRFRVSLVAPGDAAEPVRRGWAACDPLYVGPAVDHTSPGSLISRDTALFLPDAGTMVIGAKRADDGDGAVVKVLDVAGAGRSVGVWPAAWAFTTARAVNLVEMNADALPVAGDHHVALDVKPWGVAAARLFTPRASTG